MINTSTEFFLGANTPEGFYSLFDELYCPEDGWRLCIIKGGPGTGKSSLMKKIAAEADKRGCYCERIYCSSDPGSLDGVILPGLKISVADGTAPHVLEPRFPGVSEVIVDLGAYRDDKKLRAKADEIINLTLLNSEEHKKCVGFLKAAAAVNADTKQLAGSALRAESLRKFASHLINAEIAGNTGDGAHESRRFLSALTPRGGVCFTDTAANMCERIIVLEDDLGAASALLLRLIIAELKKNGLSYTVCTCPMSPGKKPEHIFIPSLSLGFFTSNRFHPYDGEADKTVNCRRFYDDGILEKNKHRLTFDRRAQDELINEALRKLGYAKELHDKLEKYYIAAMDFDGVAAATDKLIREIFN